MKKIIRVLIILALISSPIKTGYVKHWELRPNGRTIASPEIIKELGFGREFKRLYPRITFKDSVRCTIYPDKRQYDTWDGKTL